MLVALPPDKNKNACKQRQKTSDDADAKSGESDDSHRDKIDCEQEHADIFGDHVVSISNCA